VGYRYSIIFICIVQTSSLVSKPEAGAESESEKCDSIHLWNMDLDLIAADL